MFFLEKVNDIDMYGDFNLGKANKGYEYIVIDFIDNNICTGIINTTPERKNFLKKCVYNNSDYMMMVKNNKPIALLHYVYFKEHKAYVLAGMVIQKNYINSEIPIVLLQYFDNIIASDTAAMVMLNNNDNNKKTIQYLKDHKYKICENSNGITTWKRNYSYFIY